VWLDVGGGLEDFEWVEFSCFRFFLRRRRHDRVACWFVGFRSRVVVKGGPCCD